jgi:hypothetical protein
MENGLLGKKVFFLYPPPVLTEVIDILTHEEFEVYLTKDHVKLKRLLASFPDAILFVNLDDGMDNAGWLSYVASIRKDVSAVGVGILTLNDDVDLREHFLMNMQVQCGFVILKLGVAKTAEILVKTLEANEARGRRKFVRALCSPGTGQCTVEHEGATLRAVLSDLSSTGMAIDIEGGTELRIGTVLRDISLTIKGQRLLVSGFVVAKRLGDAGERDVHVVMFDPGSLDDNRRDKLKSSVFKINQATMDLALERA